MNILRSLCSLLSGMLCPIFLQLDSTCHLSQFKCRLLRETSNSSITCYISFLFSLFIFFFMKYGYMPAKLLQLCPTLCDPMDCSPQAPLSMGFSSQEYQSGSPCRSPGDLPDPEIKCASLMSPALAGGFFTISANWEAQYSQFHGLSRRIL